MACQDRGQAPSARSILLSGQYSRTCTGALGNAAWRVSDKTRRRLRDKTIAEAARIIRETDPAALIVTVLLGIAVLAAAAYFVLL